MEGLGPPLPQGRTAPELSGARADAWPSTRVAGNSNVHSKPVFAKTVRVRSTFPAVTVWGAHCTVGQSLRGSGLSGHPRQTLSPCPHCHPFYSAAFFFFVLFSHNIVSLFLVQFLICFEDKTIIHL